MNATLQLSPNHVMCIRCCLLMCDVYLVVFVHVW